MSFPIPFTFKGDARAAQERLLRGYVAGLPDGDYEVAFTKKRGAKTPAQLGYYFAVCLPLIAERVRELTGEPDYDDEQAHHEVTRELSSRALVDRDTGEVVAWRVLRLSAMDAAECSLFIDRVILWAGEKLQVEIPPPEVSRARRARREAACAH